MKVCDEEEQSNPIAGIAATILVIGLTATGQREEPPHKTPKMQLELCMAAMPTIFKSFNNAEELRTRRLEFLGIYHSHPHWMDMNEPPPKDIALAHSSEAIHFIVTPRPYASTPIRAFSIRDRRAPEFEVQLLP